MFKTKTCLQPTFLVGHSLASLVWNVELHTERSGLHPALTGLKDLACISKFAPFYTSAHPSVYRVKRSALPNYFTLASRISVTSQLRSLSWLRSDLQVSAEKTFGMIPIKQCWQSGTWENAGLVCVCHSTPECLFSKKTCRNPLPRKARALSSVFP